ncbi:hypothetical protein H6P81_000697 [Aristolochia fimbriata]|uniref:Uncharacterized protein n=1 Tax=Aristolochia fimbriata TaxID=158543 RepID=A0AAV7F6G2_ARIFI|nr:hypothetical protein H6P81_000697 [Aristolochia fimbriata]
MAGLGGKGRQVWVAFGGEKRVKEGLRIDIVLKEEETELAAKERRPDLPRELRSQGTTRGGREKRRDGKEREEVEHCTGSRGYGGLCVYGGGTGREVGVVWYGVVDHCPPLPLPSDSLQKS